MADAAGSGAEEGSKAKATRAEVGGQATGADVADAVINEAEEGSKWRGDTCARRCG